MTAEPAGMSAAERELDNVQALIAAHQARCHRRTCTTCTSLTRHLTRCKDQMLLLAADADQGALF